ncbi:MAG: kelch repeat-containing protein [Bryobacteraceae bacterium]
MMLSLLLALAGLQAAELRVPSVLAPEMLVSAYADAIRADGVYAVDVVDSAGVEWTAALTGVADGAVRFVMPAGMALGEGSVAVRGVASAKVRIAQVAPELFAVGDWFVADSKGAMRPRPLEGMRWKFLGTGFRGARVVTARLGDTEVTVESHTRWEAPGVDEVTLGPMPLASRWGEVELRIVADGAESNAVPVAPGLPLFGGWGRRAELLAANSEMGVAELDGWIYVLGGYPASRQTVATVQAYDPGKDEWRLKAPLPRGVNHSMPAVVNGKLYVIGGQSDAGNTSFVDTNYMYDPSTDAWVEKARLPLARGGGAAAVVDGKIYVAGGRPPRGADFAVYDPVADTWTVLPDVPTQRNHLAAVAVNGKVYVIGGRFQAGFTSPQTDVVEIFDPATGKWTAGAKMIQARGGINGIAAYGCIHVFGGEGNSAAPNGVYPHHDVYDPVADTWERLDDPMPIPVHGVTGAAFVRGLIYLPGGGTSDGGSSGGTQHQVYRPRHNCAVE